ncbi:MAG: hypothetical protein IT201_04935 [Thermoleophilia bacterium]|nr:hypothetical protein [Thermoleophilia bacterium]
MTRAASGGERPPNARPTHVFIVGTGRSGTATIADLLSAPPGCVVEHEREPKLLTEVSDYLAGRIEPGEMAELLSRTRNPEAIGGERLSGEANQRLSFVLGPLAEAFPHARLVWLLRDGRTAVASMHHRGWYHPREPEVRSPVVRGWATTRVAGDAVGDVAPDEWERLDAFGRCCWYWSYTGRVIAASSGRLPLLRVKLEELAERRLDLAAFLGVAELASAAVPRSNASSSGRPTSWRLWSPRQRATFARLCGPVMDEHYPGWRDELTLAVHQHAAALAARGLLALRSGLASATRPLRTRIGLVRRQSGPAATPGRRDVGV